MIASLRLLCLSFVIAAVAVACGGPTKVKTSIEGGKGAPTRDPMSLMANTTNAVVVLRPQKLRGSKLDPIARGLIDKAGVGQLLAACAINPLEQVELVILAGELPSPTGSAFIRGDFDRKRLDDCAAKVQASMPGLAVKRDGELWMLSLNGRNLYVAWVSGGALVTPVKTRAQLVGVDGPPPSLRAQLATFSPDALVSFAVLASALNAGGDENLLNALPPEARPQQLAGSVRLASGIKVNMRGRTTSEAGANTARTKLQELWKKLTGASMAGALLRPIQFEVTAAGADVTLAVSISQTHLDALLSMFKMAVSM